MLKFRIYILVNPRTAGGLSHLRTAGGTYVPPANSKTTQRIDKRKKNTQ